ncbi:MAG: dihydroorotase [Bacteroidota bacterium]
MKLIIRQATIIDQESAFNKKTCDVLVSDGIIKKIAGKITEACDQEIDGKNCFLSPGFFDLHVNFREPGFEYKEDLQSGCKAAMAGGFTGVLQMPSTFPVMQNRSGIELIRNKTKEGLVDVEVSGALSVDLEGSDMTEMFDMHQSGAVCFTDDKKSVEDAGMMVRALLYAKNFNGLIMSFANDKSLSGKGQMNEGIISTQLGLKGMPALAEELMIARDLMLCEYAESKIHFSTVSTKGAVELIRNAKAKGLKVTCDVAAHHLLLNDSNLEEFDTRFKIKPPLRTDADIAALKNGLKDGTIDAICSDHSPEDIENKQKEFDHAAFGAEGLETAFAAAYTALKDILTTEQLVEKLSTSPRKILGLSAMKISEGEKANFTLFTLAEEWTVSVSDIHSKSKNNPFIGRKLQGKIKAALNNGQFFIS